MNHLMTRLLLLFLNFLCPWSYSFLCNRIQNFGYRGGRGLRFNAIQREEFLATLFGKDLPVSPYPQRNQLNYSNNQSFSWSYSDDFSVRTQLQKYQSGNLSLQYLTSWPSNNINPSLDCLHNASFIINDISIKDNIIIVNWNLTYFPSTIRSLLTITNMLRPNCHREFFDLLPYERMISEFSWRKLFQFFQDLLIFNCAKIPIAKILGRTEITYIEEELIGEPNINNMSITKKKYTFKSMTETLQLIENINNQITQNRRIVLDLLEYLNARRISSYENLNDYNSLILQNVRFSYISNMNMMSVDGLNQPNQLQTSQVLSASNVVLTLFTSFVLLIGTAFALSLLSNMFAPNSGYYIENRDYLG